MTTSAIEATIYQWACSPPPVAGNSHLSISTRPRMLVDSQFLSQLGNEEIILLKRTRTSQVAAF